MRDIKIFFLGFALLLLAMQGCVQDPEVKLLFIDKEIPLVDYMRTDPTLSISVEALEKAKLAGTVNSYGPFTFFAPDNQAWAKYFTQRGVSGLDGIKEVDLRLILQYHILPKRKKAIDFIQGTLPDSTVNGDYIKLDIGGGVSSGTIINSKAKIYNTNIEVSNAIIHKIDAVLDPPINTLADYLANTPSLSILKAGMERAGLMDTLRTIRSLNALRPNPLNGPFKLKTALTLFAETDDVFNAAGITLETINNMNLGQLRRLMRYHIALGNIRTTDIISTTNYKNLGVAGGFLDAINLETLSPIDFINYDKLEANKINKKVNIKPTGQDIFVRNGIVQLIDKPLNFIDIGTVRRIPIIHEAEDRFYAYGIRFVGGNGGDGPRIFGPERASNERPSTFFAFMKADSPGDSMVLIVPAVQKGKYKITLSYKKAGSRAEVQSVIGGKTAGLGKINMASFGGNYEQNAVVSNSFEFKTSGNKRIAFMVTGAGNRWEVPLDVLVLTPVK